jgi:hypothetical protein
MPDGVTYGTSVTDEAFPRPRFAGITPKKPDPALRGASMLTGLDMPQEFTVGCQRLPLAGATEAAGEDIPGPENSH